MLSILLCDDKDHELREIAGHIAEYYSGDCTITSFTKPDDALAFAQNGCNVDLALLDIVMPETSGIELAEKLRASGFSGELVFITTANSFAAQSYKVRALSYLLKPVSKAEIFELLDRFSEMRSDKETAGLNLARRGYSRFIKFSELMYIEVIDHYLYFHLSGGEIVKIYSTLREYLDELLADSRLIQCHRSFLVNMDYIGTFESREITMKNGARLAVSKNYTELQKTYLKWTLGKKSAHN